MTHQREVEIKICDNEEELAAVAADLVVERSELSIGRRGKFFFALSGGTTPRGLYELLATPAYRDKVNWKRTEVFWVDEQCVPPDHPDSNYRMAHDLLLSKLSLEEAQVHRIRGEEEPETAAKYYSQEATAFIHKNLFSFDVAVLGVGADGHTASIFPGDPAVSEKYTFALVVEPKGQQHKRITVTIPVLNHVATALFLAAGPEKASVVREILDEGNPKGHPAGLVVPHHGELLWCLDHAAAAQLRAEE